MELPLDDHRVDGASRVVDDEELQQPHGERLHIDLDDRGLHAEGPRDRLRIEVRADAEPRLADAAERLRLHRGLRDAAEADEAIGHTGNVGAPALDAYVGCGTFEQLGGDSRRALAHLACRACDGGPYVGGHAAPSRAHAEGEEGRITADDLDVVERRTQFFGGDLRERRRVSLPLRGHADEHVDLAARIDANGRPLERAEPCPLGITPEPDPQALFGLRARLLPAAPVLVAEESQCAFEGRGKITRIVGDRDAVLVREARTVRHLVGAHQIAAPDVGRVEAEAPRTEVHEALHDEHRLRTPRRTVRRVRRLGGDDARSRVPVRRHAVRTGKMVHRVERQAVALEGIGADVRKECGVDADDAAIAGEADRGVVDLLPVLAQRRQVLAACLHPFHRPPKAPRRGGDEDVLGVHGALGSEPTADIGNEDPHPLHRQFEDGGDRLANPVGILRGRHHDQRAGVRVVVGEHAARLDGRRGEARVADRLVDHDVGARERGLGVADRATRDERRIVGPLGVQARRRRQPALGRRDWRQRLIVHRDHGQRIGEVRSRVSDRDPDRLTDVARDDAGENGHAVGAPSLGAGGDERAAELGQITGRPDAEHPRRRQCIRRGDLHDPRVGLTASNHPEMHDAIPM